MRTPHWLIAALFTTSLITPFTAGAAPHGGLCGQTGPGPGSGSKPDLVESVSDLLNLSSEQQSRMRAELHRLHEQQREERASHHRAMRERHHADLRKLENLLEPQQIQLYRAFLQGLELGRSRPQPHPGTPQRKVSWR